MSSNGVDATTIQQITDGANIGFGTFYNYCVIKEALALDVLDCVIHNLGERYELIDGNRSIAWSQLVWMMTAAARDIIDGHVQAEDLGVCVEAILRINGVDFDRAHAAIGVELPISPELAIDFSFEAESSLNS